MVRMRRSKGFTLIELAVTVAIVGLLASVAVPMAELAVQRNREQELRTSLRQLRTAIDAYKQAADEGKLAVAAGDSGYPSSLEVLVEGVDNLKDPKGGKLYFLRRLPRDPMAAADGRPAAETWGKRSYRSEPDEPKEGEDVFDVYSGSDATGLNGIAYAEW
jgi:general secretion pathway protein G